MAISINHQTRQELLTQIHNLMLELVNIHRECAQKSEVTIACKDLQSYIGQLASAIEKLMPSKIMIASIRQKDLSQRKGDFGEAIFQALIELKLGWIAIESKELDISGIDRIFRLMQARIETQIKTAFMAVDKSWTFTVFKKGKKLDIDFYSQPNAFLVLIGLHYPIPKVPKYLKRARDPLWLRKTILMISGKKVIEHFKDKKTGNITINWKKLKNNEYKWLRGTDNPFKIFADEYERQTGFQMPEPPME